jgi:hypothetical protein
MPRFIAAILRSAVEPAAALLSSAQLKLELLLRSTADTSAPTHPESTDRY